MTSRQLKVLLSGRSAATVHSSALVASPSAPQHLQVSAQAAVAHAVAPVEALPQAQLVQECAGHVGGGCAAGQRQLHARLSQPVQDTAFTRCKQPVGNEQRKGWRFRARDAVTHITGSPHQLTA